MRSEFSASTFPHCADNSGHVAVTSGRHTLPQVCFLLAAGVLFLFGAVLAFGQADQGAITGTIQDPNGAVCANAQVVLTNTDTNLTLETHSDQSGVYVFSPIKIGNYKVAASAPGFARITRSDLHIDIQQRLNIDLQLKPGSTSESIEVTSAPPIMQTEEASVGQVISTTTIDQTPLNGRNWVYIAQMSAGVVPPEGTRGNGKGDFNANGQRAEQNNFILDGVDDNTNVVDFLNGASYVVRPPPDALAEFKIQTSDYSAEFGHSAGAVVNASLKSGTNQVHGSLWEYVRNTSLDARDWDSTTIPAYHENQFGATLGLPIIKNKLFFFGDLEANRILFGQATVLTVPTELMRQGNFTELLNGTFNGTGQPVDLTEPGSSTPMGSACGNPQNVMCASEIDPLAKKLLNLYPLPNVNASVFANNYQINRNTRDNTFQFDTRMDWNISGKDQAFARFSLLNDQGYYPAPLGNTLDGGNFLQFGTDGNIVNLGQNSALSETHVFNGTLVNEFRFGYNWGHFAYEQANANNPGFAQSLGLGGIPGGANNGGLPAVNVGGITGFGSPEFYVASEYQNVFQILDNVTKTVGKHALKFGVNFQHVRFSTLEPPVARGEYDYYSGAASCADSITYTGYGISDFLANMMGCAQISNYAGTDDVRWDRSVYAQDDWKATSRLTVNLGLRYEYPQTYRELYGRQAEWYTTGGLVAGNTPSVYVIPTQSQSSSLGSVLPGLLATDHVALPYSDNPYLVNQDTTNFAPRIGLAYKLSNRATVRGGYGMFYGGLESVGYNPNLGANAPFVYQSNYLATAANGTDGITLENGFVNQLAAGLINSVVTPNLRGVDPNVKTPYSEDYNLAIEYGITNNMVATASYVGSQSHHLIVFTNPNAPLALQNSSANPTTEQPLPNFGSAIFSSYSGVANYNSLQAKLEKRFSRGLSFLATYTFAHALDDAPTPLGSNGDNGYPNTNIQPIHDQYSNSPFDTRHRFTFDGSYQLPFGKGRRFASRAGVMDYLVGGWSSSLTFAAQTGNPFSVVPYVSSPYSEPAGASVVYAVEIGDPFKAGGSGSTCAGSVRNKNNWYNPCAFANPLSGANIAGALTGAAAMPYFGGRRDVIYGPGYERINMSWFKDFPIREGKTLQFRADIFNLFNTPSYANPNSNSSGGGLQSGVNNTSSAGGQITLPRFFQNFTPDARFFQLALKFSF